MYDTPYGALSIGINTRKMRAALDDHGGQIEIDYAIEIDHAVAGENLFRINVREKGPLHLDPALEKGEWRPLTPEELAALGLS